MAESKQEESETIHDQHLKVPDITSISTDTDSLLITFIFVQKSIQSFDNSNDDNHNGAAHKHGDEVFTIQKELQFHEIETEIKCNNKWISLGGFRTINLLQKAHLHSADGKHNEAEHFLKQIDENENDESNQNMDDSITLCYPFYEINQYLTEHNLQWINVEKYKQNMIIRMRLKYKIEYRVAHLNNQVDNIISAYSKTQSLVPKKKNNVSQPKEQKIKFSFLPPQAMIFDICTPCKDVNTFCCLSLCSNKSIQIDELSKECKTRSFLSSKYPNDWIFFPSLTIGSLSNYNFTQSMQRESFLFTFDGYNKDNHTLCQCHAVNLNDSKWHKMPSLNVARSRAQIIYAPNCEQLICCGGYVYDANNGTKYLDSIEYFNLHYIKEQKFEWKIGKKQMRTKRCEHSVGIISNKQSTNNQDLCLIAGGSSNTFLRSCSILSIKRENGDNVTFGCKRGGLMKEACIKGTVCHDLMNNNGDNVYLIGGNNGFGSTRNAQCFNLEKNKWQMIKGTRYAHDDYPCVWMTPDGLMGVVGHSQQLACVEYYDCRSDEWIFHCQYPESSVLALRMLLWNNSKKKL